MDNPLLNVLAVPEKLGDKFFWATVTAVSPLRVQEDTALAPIPATPKTLTPCAPGDRVFCLRTGRRLIVLGKLGDNIPENSIYVAGKWWPASGTVPCPTFSSWYTWTGAGVYYKDLSIPLPYSPPEGYSFALSAAQNIGTPGLIIQREIESFPNGALPFWVISLAGDNKNCCPRIAWQLVKK